MNIAIVVYAYYSRDARVKKYAEYLARKGIKVDCICLKEDFVSKEKNISFIQFPLSRRRLGKLWYLIEYLFFFLFSSWILLIYNFARRYQIIHINNIPDFLVFAALVPKMLGTKIILDMHDPMPELYMDKYSKAATDLSVRILIFIERISLQFADHVLTANENFRTLFINRARIRENKISVILNCPDTHVFNPKMYVSKHARRFTIFYMGTVEKRFCLEEVINSIPVLIKYIPKLQFIIVPKLKEEGSYLKSLIKKVKKDKLMKYVKIESPKSNSQIARMLGSIDIGLALYKPSPYTDRLLSVKLFEYVQMNIPVITTKTKAISQYFTENQLYFLSNNTPKELQAAILALFHKPALRKSLAHNAKEYLRKYTWSEERKKYLRIVYSMAKN